MLLQDIQKLIISFYMFQCTDGLCWLREVSTLGEASSPWPRHCIENTFLGQWPRALESTCKLFPTRNLYQI